MGKTYMALLRSEKENAQKLLQPVPVPSQDWTPVLWDPLGGIPQLVPEWFKELKTRLDVNPANRDVKTILFTSTSLKSGCSSIAAAFAKCLSMDFNKRVLLIDVNIRNSNLQNYFGNEYIQDIEEMLADNKLGFSQSPEKWSRKLHVISCDSQEADSSCFFASDRFKHAIDSAKEIFDYIILDSSPITLFSETRTISAKVDGVILIIEAGKTRRQAALRAKREIESAGGTFLGSVLNKRKFYIPNWLYRRL